jgi:hypothetical protein
MEEVEEDEKDYEPIEGRTPYDIGYVRQTVVSDYYTSG